MTVTASGTVRERFAAIPVLNVVQAAVAACVGFAALALLESPGGARHGRAASTPASPPTGSPPFTAFLRVSLSHTLASPVGYAALVRVGG